jgi:hypothetical protein
MGREYGVDRRGRKYQPPLVVDVRGIILARQHPLEYLHVYVQKNK